MEEFRLRYRNEVLALRLLALVAAAAQVSCAGTIERAFHDDGHSYPLHVDATVVQPNVLNRDGCTYQPERRSEIAPAALRVRADDVRTFAAQYCPESEAQIVAQPFLVESADNVPLLGMHVHCYGRGTLRGLTMEEPVDHYLLHRKDLDSWLYERDEQGAYWILSNVALFDLNGGLAFVRMLKSYEPADENALHGELAAINANIPFDEIGALQTCGRLREPPPREDNRARRPAYDEYGALHLPDGGL